MLRAAKPFQLTCTLQMVSVSWTSSSSTFMPCGIAVWHAARRGCTNTTTLVRIRSVHLSHMSILPHALAEPPPSAWTDLLPGAATPEDDLPALKGTQPRRPAQSQPGAKPPSTNCSPLPSPSWGATPAPG